MLLCLLRRALEIRGAEAFCTTEPGQGLGQRSEGGLSTGSWHQPHVGGTTVLPRTQRLTHIGLRFLIFREGITMIPRLTELFF